MRVHERPIQCHCEESRDNSLDAVHAGRHALANQRVEQLVSMRPGDIPKRHRARRRNQYFFVFATSSFQVFVLPFANLS
jgi:hypothetical protein